MLDSTPLQPTSVRLDDQQWSELFENIELAEQMIPGRERREHQRFEYAAQITLYAQFDQPGSEGGEAEWQLYLVRTRNISASGLGFIHHAEVVVGTRALITAFDKQGQAIAISGVSARADLIEDGVWDIGIRFEETIDPAGLLDAAGKPLAAIG